MFAQIKAMRVQESIRPCIYRNRVTVTRRSCRHCGAVIRTWRSGRYGERFGGCIEEICRFPSGRLAAGASSPPDHARRSNGPMRPSRASDHALYVIDAVSRVGHRRCPDPAQRPARAGGTRHRSPAARACRPWSIARSSALGRALALAANPGRFLSTVQIGITLVGVCRARFPARRSVPPRRNGLSTRLRAGVAEAVGVGLVVAVITYFSLVSASSCRSRSRYVTLKDRGPAWRPP